MAADPEEFAAVLVEAFRPIPTVAPLWAAVEAAADIDSDVAARREELLSGATATLRTLVRVHGAGLARWVPSRSQGWLES